MASCELPHPPLIRDQVPIQIWRSVDDLPTRLAAVPSETVLGILPRQQPWDTADCDLQRDSSLLETVLMMSGQDGLWNQSD